jgi:hypothetical protein
MSLRVELTIVPAYGRDYKTAKDAAHDWFAGKDFRIADIGSRYNGAYCSVRDPIDARIRFNGGRQVTFCRGG